MAQQGLPSPRTHHPTPVPGEPIILGQNDITRTRPEIMQLDTLQIPPLQRSPRQHTVRVEAGSNSIWTEFLLLARF